MRKCFVLPIVFRQFLDKHFFYENWFTVFSIRSGCHSEFSLPKSSKHFGKEIKVFHESQNISCEKEMSPNSFFFFSKIENNNNTLFFFFRNCSIQMLTHPLLVFRNLFFSLDIKTLINKGRAMSSKTFFDPDFQLLVIWKLG